MTDSNHDNDSKVTMTVSTMLPMTLVMTLTVTDYDIECIDAKWVCAPYEGAPS